MNSKWLVTALMCLTLTATALAAQQKVTLANGRVLTGEVTKTKDGYTIKLESGMEVQIADDQVSKVEKIVTPVDEFAQRWEKVDKKNASDLVALASWADEKGLLEQAAKTLNTALKVDPKNERAKLLLKVVEAKIEAKKDEGNDTQGNGNGEDEQVTVDGQRLDPKWLVDMEDIYRIRLEEIRPDERVTVKYENDVLDRFIRMMEGIEEFKQPRFDQTFRGWPRSKQLHFILDKIDRDNDVIKNDIHIVVDPKFMVEFRNYIYPVVRQFLDSPKVRANRNDVGGLRLLTVGGRNTRVDYTNYLILYGFKYKGQRMIDRDVVEDSLILQWGLPRDIARYPHPIEQPPTFSSTKSPQYRRIEKWIQQLKRPVEADYDLKWKPPFDMKLDLQSRPGLPDPTPDTPTTQPTTAPAGPGLPV